MEIVGIKELQRLKAVDAAARDLVLLWTNPKIQAMTTLSPERVAEIRALAIRVGDFEVSALDRFVISVTEFLCDWKKGDFELSTLAALDAQDSFNKQPAAFEALKCIAEIVPTLPTLLSSHEALRAENDAMRAQIEASQMRRLEIGDEIKDKLAQRLADAELTTARDTAAREMREACVAWHRTKAGELYEVQKSAEENGVGFMCYAGERAIRHRQYADELEALPLPSEKETG